MRNFVLAVLLGCASVCPVAGADKTAPKPAADLPAVKELPNPFTFLDGSPVRTEDDWKRRREELKSLFEDYQDGRLPAKPKKVTINRGKKVTDDDNNVTIQLLKAGDRISIRSRPVGHVPSNDDLLDYADYVFFDKKLPEAFGKLEYKEETKGFSWDVPK